MKKAFVWFALVALTSCTAYKEVVVKEILNVQILSFNSDGAECEIEMSVVNPNNYKITLTESEVDLFFEGKPLGKVELMEDLVIAKKSDMTIKMKCLADPQNLKALFGNILTLLFKSEFVMEGKGYVKGKAMFVSKKFPVEFIQKVSREELGF